MTDDIVTRLLALRPEDRRSLLTKVGGLSDETRGDPVGPAASPRTQWPMRFAASLEQREMWMLWRMDSRDTSHHVPLCYDVSGPLQAGCLAHAVDAVVARHEALRTTFTEDGAQVHQVVHRRLPAAFRVQEVGSRDRAVQLAAEAIHETFDLRSGPLVRVRLFRCSPRRHVLLVAMHHIIVDERSTRILERELAAYYTAATTDRPVALPSLPVQYGDYVAWQLTLDGRADLAHWRAQLADAKPTRLRPDRPWPSAVSLRGATEHKVLSGARPALAGLATRFSCSEFTVFAALFALFLSGETGQDDVSFGSPASVRRHPAAEGLIGYFMNLVTMRIRSGEAATFADLVAATHRAAAGAVRHQAAPFSQVASAGRGKPDAYRGPLFDAMLVFLYDDQSGESLELGPGVAMTSVELSMPNARRFVTFVLAETAAGATLAVLYPADVYDQSTVSGWIDRLDTLLARAASDPDGALSAVLKSVRTPAERDSAGPGTGV